MIKRILAATTALTLATSVSAQSADFSERVAADLATQGYTDVEIEIEGTTVVAEGDLNGSSFEFIYDLATETLLSTEEEIETDDDDDDDEDDDAEDESEDDEDEDEDDEDEDEDDEDDDDEEDEEDDDEDDA